MVYVQKLEFILLLSMYRFPIATNYATSRNIGGGKSMMN